MQRKRRKWAFQKRTWRTVFRSLVCHVSVSAIFVSVDRAARLHVDKIVSKVGVLYQCCVQWMCEGNSSDSRFCSSVILYQRLQTPEGLLCSCWTLQLQRPAIRGLDQPVGVHVGGFSHTQTQGPAHRLTVPEQKAAILSKPLQQSLGGLTPNPAVVDGADQPPLALHVSSETAARMRWRWEGAAALIFCSVWDRG